MMHTIDTQLLCRHLGCHSSRVIDPGYSKQSGCTGEVQYRRIKLNGFSALDRYYLDCSVTAGLLLLRRLQTTRLSFGSWTWVCTKNRPLNECHIYKKQSQIRNKGSNEPSINLAVCLVRAMSRKATYTKENKQPDSHERKTFRKSAL